MNRSIFNRIAVYTFLAAAFVGLIGCGPSGNLPPGSNGGNSVANSNGNLVTPTPVPSPSATPCDDRAVDQKLVEEFTSPGNQGGPDGFAKIQKTVNFYSKGCDVFLWGYTKNFGTFKRLQKIFRETPRSPRLITVNLDNLYIEESEYPPGDAPGCAPGYKACNDICIPEGDPCWAELAAAARSASTTTEKAP